jgi:ABC-type Zn uptake system ZnuABC Zn-binding protein ZnuA
VPHVICVDPMEPHYGAMLRAGIGPIRNDWIVYDRGFDYAADRWYAVRSPQADLQISAKDMESLVDAIREADAKLGPADPALG